jgi:hypothetical protein
MEFRDRGIPKVKGIYTNSSDLKEARKWTTLWKDGKAIISVAYIDQGQQEFCILFKIFLNVFFGIFGHCGTIPAALETLSKQIFL